MLSAVELILLLTTLTIGLYWYLTRTFNFWESRGIKGPKPIILFGTAKSLTTGEENLGMYILKIYNKWRNEPLVGIYLGQDPVLVVNDLDLVKDVLIKDFSKFADRGLPVFEKVEPLSQHLFNLETTRWRPLRLKLSPVFTSGKLKEMFYLLDECVEHFEKFIDHLITETGGDELITEFRELTAKFTTDVIGVCAFGLQMNALAEEDSPFRVMGKRIFETPWKRIMQLRVRKFAPKLYGVIGGLLDDKEMTNFFIDTMRQTMDYRKKKNVVKRDFIDLLMAMKDQPDKLTEIELTDDLLAAQLFVFFIAGFETSSTTMSNAFYELAQNHEIQGRLRREIRDELARTGGVIGYDGIKDMTYLDMVFNETLRKYPPATVLLRKATDAYTFRDASQNELLTIQKDQRIIIPLHGIQKDPQFFPKPEVFDPERYTVEAVKSRHPMTELAFGDGPRNCIGKRFGVMQTKVGLVKILNRYEVDICDKTEIPYATNPKSFILAPLNGIHLKITRIHEGSTNL